MTKFIGSGWDDDDWAWGGESVGADWSGLGYKGKHSSGRASGPARVVKGGKVIREPGKGKHASGKPTPKNGGKK